MQKKKAISLIVLIITIIVMIILAGTIILSLNNSGILEKATLGVEQTNLSTVQEIASLKWAEAYIDGARAQEDLEKAVLDGLKEGGITEQHYKDYEIVVTQKGVTLQSKTWKKQGLTLTKGEHNLTIGQTIQYTATGTDYTGSWKVLGVNDKGEVLIMPGEDIAAKLTLERNLYETLDDIQSVCDTYAQGDGALGARLISAQDINSLTGYNPIEAKYHDGQIDAYGKQISCYWNGNEKVYCVYGPSENENYYVNTTGKPPKFYYYKNGEYVSSEYTEATEENPVLIDKITNTAYAYYPDTLTDNSSDEKKGLNSTTPAYKMLFENDQTGRDTSYILSDIFSGVIDIAQKEIWSGYMQVKGNYLRSIPIYGVELIDSNTMFERLDIRPVITLSLDYVEKILSEI